MKSGKILRECSGHDVIALDRNLVKIAIPSDYDLHRQTGYAAIGCNSVPIDEEERS